jgi:predicted transglutaminase-like cysteine proteinase
MQSYRYAKVALKAALMTMALSQVAACASTDAFPQASAMTIGTPVAPPAGFMAFCQRTPEECQTAGPTLVVSDPAAVSTPGQGAPTIAQSGQLTWASRAPYAAPDAQASDTTAAPAAGFRSNRGGADWGALFTAARFERAEIISVAAKAPPPSSVPPLTLTRDVMATLNRVNQGVNRKITFGDDSKTWGANDYWALPLEQGKGVGDCEDYVLEKRRALVAAGVPPQVLSIALVLTTWGESHAVLLVATERGDMVLDNLSSWVTPWSATGYRGVERQAPGGDAMAWVSVASFTPG